MRKVRRLIYPSIDHILNKVDSRYSLVILAAKRARQLRETHVPKEGLIMFKEVSTALEDIANDRITFERTKNGIK